MTRRIAILISAVSSHSHRLLRGIATHVPERGRWEFLYNPWRQADDVQDLDRADGIIAYALTPAMAQTIQASGLPAVNVCGSLLPLPPLPSVLPDDQEIGRLAARSLLRKGFTHLAYFGRTDRRFSIERQAGFTAEARQQGVEVAAILSPPMEPQENVAFLVRHMAELPRPAGAMACNDDMALRVLRVAPDAGIRIPDDLAVIGADNDDVLCELSHPRLSSIAPSSFEQGRAAGQLLERLLAGGRAPRKPLRLPPLELIERASSDILAVSDQDLLAAIRFIREHAHEGITVRDVLRATPVSRRWLELLFQRHLQRSPADEIRRMRLNRARTLLVDRSLSMLQIALRCGFGSQAQFCASFRRDAGVTPSEFRRQVCAASRL